MENTNKGIHENDKNKTLKKSISNFYQKDTFPSIWTLSAYNNQTIVIRTSSVSQKPKLHSYKIFQLPHINQFKLLRYIAKISTVRVKQHINTGFIPPSASKTDLWPLPGKAARDSGYSKARLGHSLLIKIFFKLDCLITWTYPDLPSFGLLRNQNSQVLGQVSSPKRPIWWDSSANRSLKGGSPYNFSLETVLPNYIHFYTDYQCTSPRCSILGSSVFTPRKYE